MLSEYREVQMSRVV